MQGNILGQSGEASVSGLNVFAQLAEPRKKDGVWIKTERVALNEFVTTNLTDIPYEFYKGSTVAVGANVYLFGGGTGGVQAYKYDTLTGTYTKLVDIPLQLQEKYIVTNIGTDVFLFNTNMINKGYAYKYDTLTNTYTKLAEISITNSIFKFATAIETDVFLFEVVNNTTLVHKYDSLTDTFSSLANTIQGVSEASIAIGTTIYSFGCSTGGDTIYDLKYDILTDTFTLLRNIVKMGVDEGIAFLIDNDIYVFSPKSSTEAYKFNILAGTRSSLSVTSKFFRNLVVRVGVDFYEFGGSVSSVYKNARKISQVVFPEMNRYKYNEVEMVEDDEMQFVNKMVYLESDLQLVKMKLTKKLTLYISSAFIYDNNERKVYPVYYGNGEEWTKIS